MKRIQELLTLAEDSSAYSIELDWFSEHPYAAEIKKEAANLARRFNATLEMVKERGPGGGASVIRFFGLKKDLIKLIAEYDDSSMEDAAEFFNEHGELAEETLKEAALSAQLKRLARDAGYNTNDLDDLKSMWAERALSSPYADDYEARLGEALGMIQMTEKELRNFVNGKK